ncbi:hypothetical protein BGZ54_002956, partial [Gamsiella multidivaricata]
MEKPSIFDVPLLKDEVTQYLSSRDLAHCSRVSKQWSTWFRPTLWRALDFGSSDFDECTLQKHRDHVKTILRLNIAHLAADDFPLPNLWSLEASSSLNIFDSHVLLTEISGLRTFLRIAPTVLRTLKIEFWLINPDLDEMKNFDLTSRQFLDPFFVLQLFQACSNLDSLILRVRSYLTILYQDEHLREVLRKQDESANRGMEQMPKAQLRELGLY